MESSAIEIPRVFHRIWIGPNPLPDEFADFGRTWERHHPDWEMRLWTDAEVAEMEGLSEAFDRGRNEGEKADILRLELLVRFGGVHVDTDFECRRPIDPLLDGVRAFACYEDSDKRFINGGLMGAVRGYPTIERALREIPDSVGSGSVMEATGPQFLTPILVADPQLVVFGHELFFPYRYGEGRRAADEFPDAYAVHHWSHLWATREELQERLARKNARIKRLRRRVARAEARKRQAQVRKRAANARRRELERRLVRRRLRALLRRVSRS